MEKWKYRAAIASSVVVTTAMIYVGWRLIPDEYFLLTLISVGIAGSIVLDWFRTRKKGSHGDE